MNLHAQSIKLEWDRQMYSSCTHMLNTCTHALSLTPNHAPTHTHTHKFHEPWERCTHKHHARPPTQIHTHAHTCNGGWKEWNAPVPTHWHKDTPPHSHRHSFTCTHTQQTRFRTSFGHFCSIGFSGGSMVTPTYVRFGVCSEIHFGVKITHTTRFMCVRLSFRISVHVSACVCTCVQITLCWSLRNAAKQTPYLFVCARVVCVCVFVRHTASPVMVHSRGTMCFDLSASGSTS